MTALVIGLGIMFIFALFIIYFAIKESDPSMCLFLIIVAMGAIFCSIAFKYETKSSFVVVDDVLRKPNSIVACLNDGEIKVIKDNVLLYNSLNPKSVVSKDVDENIYGMTLKVLYEYKGAKF